METTRNQEIAKTICEQMGGIGLLKMMTGAKDFVAIDYGLVFRIPGRNFARDSINVVRITLTPMDEYNMEFFRERSLKLKLIRDYRGVYCDQLVELFEEATGLSLRMPRIVMVGAGN